MRFVTFPSAAAALRLLSPTVTRTVTQLKAVTHSVATSLAGLLSPGARGHGAKQRYHLEVAPLYIDIPRCTVVMQDILRPEHV